MPLFLVQPAFEISTGQLHLCGMATRFCKLRKPLLGIINQVRKVGTSVIWTISLIRLCHDQPRGQRGPDNRGCTVLLV